MSNNISVLEVAVIAAILTALLSIIPIATIAAKAWLQAKINQFAISQRPTHDEVATAINAKVAEVLGNGNNAPPGGNAQ